MRIILAIFALLLPLTIADADIAVRTKTIIEDKCTHCHGEKGEASSAIYPRLAGQNRDKSKPHEAIAEFS